MRISTPFTWLAVWVGISSRLGSRALNFGIEVEREGPQALIEPKVSIATPVGTFDNGKFNKGYVNPKDWFTPSVGVDVDIFRELRMHPVTDQSGSRGRP
jgi:hypothetical protein